MIKVSISRPGEAPLAIVGLIDENMDALLRGKAIRLELAELGMKGTLVLTYGASREDVLEELHHNGLTLYGLQRITHRAPLPRTSNETTNDTNSAPDAHDAQDAEPTDASTPSEPGEE